MAVIDDKEMQISYQAAGLILQAEMKNDPLLRQQHQYLTEQKPVVVPGTYDHIDQLFTHMGISYETLLWQNLPNAQLNPTRPLFINCGGMNAERSHAAKVLEYVEAGGLFTTTDWCLKYVVEQIFSGFVKYAGQSTGPNESFPIVADPETKIEAASWFVESGSYPIQKMDEKVKTLFTSEEFGKKYNCDPSLAVIFPWSKGRVIHYVSHLYAQMVELRNASDAQKSEVYAQEKGFDKSVLGEFADKTKTAGVRSARSTMGSILHTATRPISVMTQPVGAQGSVLTQDRFTLVCEEPIFKYAGALVDRVLVGPLKKEILLGRSPLSDVVIEAESISRRHTAIFPQDNRVYIKDLASQNGTIVNDEKLAGSKQLFYKDQIRLGAVKPIRVLAE